MESSVIARRSDARERSVRTFASGLFVDAILIVTASLIALTAAPDFVWSAEYWTVFGLMLAKTLLNSVATYTHRFFSEPTKAIQPDTIN